MLIFLVLKQKAPTVRRGKISVAITQARPEQPFLIFSQNFFSVDSVYPLHKNSVYLIWRRCLAVFIFQLEVYGSF